MISQTGRGPLFENHHAPPSLASRASQTGFWWVCGDQRHDVKTEGIKGRIKAPLVLEYSSNKEGGMTEGQTFIGCRGLHSHAACAASNMQGLLRSGWSSCNDYLISSIQSATSSRSMPSGPDIRRGKGKGNGSEELRNSLATYEKKTNNEQRVLEDFHKKASS
ncbi:hypothetical protein VTI74DRAFT_10207 [Chaetomium olivicolor]